MCGRGSDSTTLPEPTGDLDNRFGYRVTEEGLKALEEYGKAHRKQVLRKVPLPDTVAEALHSEARDERTRRRRQEARSRGRRLLTVCSRFQPGGRVPDLRMTGRWLEAAGFASGQQFDVEVEAGKLTLRIV